MCTSHRFGGLLRNICPSILLLHDTSACVYLEESIPVCMYMYMSM